MKKISSLIIPLVWIWNGLFCKVLNLLPRHELIISKITEYNHTRQLTVLIGTLEILMTLWILSGIKPKTNGFMQITVIAIMNILEFMLVPDLLLWGKFNSVFALLFILLVYYNNFYLKNEPKKNHNVIIF